MLCSMMRPWIDPTGTYLPPRLPAWASRFPGPSIIPSYTPALLARLLWSIYWMRRQSMLMGGVIKTVVASLSKGLPQIPWLLGGTNLPYAYPVIGVVPGALYGPVWVLCEISLLLNWERTKQATLISGKFSTREWTCNNKQMDLKIYSDSQKASTNFELVLFNTCVFFYLHTYLNSFSRIVYVSVMELNLPTTTTKMAYCIK